MAPFFRYGYFGEDAGLFVALVIGIFFGVILERAGFGSATKLASQFYGRDLTVFKVMFTAIITALLGIFWLSWLGILDYSRLYILPTYLVPQLVGGLLFGVGFVMGGYCPGTCCVAMATGRKDGWIHLLGMVAGIILFGELFPLIEPFYNSTPMGQVTLDEYFHLSYGVVVFIIVLFALIGFGVAEKVEKYFIPKTEQ